MLKQANQVMGPSRLVDIRQAAKYLGIGQRMLFDLTKQGQVPCVRFGRRVLYDAHDLDQVIEDQKATQKISQKSQDYA